MPKILAAQELINIDYIKSDALALKDGGLRKILLVSGVNFDLKSEDEKGMIIFAYQEFLNSLNFSVQQLIHSRKLNVDGYLQALEEHREKETSELLKNIIGDYKEFVGGFVAENPIMSKTFFIVVPYEPIFLPKVGKQALQKFFGFFGRRPTAPKAAAEKNSEQFEESLKQLDLRVDQVAAGLNRIGLRTVPLTEAEIIELIYNFYNPSTVEKKEIVLENGQ